MQKTIVIGNLGQDCEVKDHKGEKAVNFNVAVNEKWTDKQGVKQSSTTWYSCSAWGKENVAPYLKKGTKVALVGKVSASAYMDRQNNACADLKLTVHELELVETKEDSQNVETNIQPQQAQQQGTSPNNQQQPQPAPQPQYQQQHPQQQYQQPAQQQPNYGQYAPHQQPAQGQPNFQPGQRMDNGQGWPGNNPSNNVQFP